MGVFMQKSRSSFVLVRGRNIERYIGILSSQTITADTSSKKFNRQTRRLSDGVFLMSLWSCMFAANFFLAGRVVSAEESMIPSIPSPSVYASSISRSKARIVISSCEDEYGVADSDEFYIQSGDSLSENFCDDILNTQYCLLSDEESYRGKNSRELSPILSIPPICIHRRSINTDSINNIEEKRPDNPIAMDNLSANSSRSRSHYKKTGTTIAGCVVPGDGDGPYVVLAADTRATAETLVADKRCDKIHKLASNCRCCGAGTSADLDKVTRQVAYQMALHELQSSGIGNGSINNEAKKTSTLEKTELLYPEYMQENVDDAIEPLLWMRPVSIDVLCSIFQDKLFRSRGQLGANLIVGGVWNKKGYLRAIHPHGSTDVDLPFTALGSGGLAAMAVLEEGYRSSMTLQDGIKLVQRAVLSGIRNDLGSGSQVDLCVIDPDGVCRQTRGVIPEEELLPDGERNSDSSSMDNPKDPSNRTNHLIKILSRENEKDGSRENRDDTNFKGENVGVNGFGNQPFAIQSTKQRMISVERDQVKQEETWNKFLGF